MKLPRCASVIALLGVAFAVAAAAQSPSAAAVDPAVKLRQALPADVAERVLATVADARAHGLAADALEQRALKFSARGVAAADIARSVAEQAQRQARAKSLLESARGTSPSMDEVEAGAEALREGVDGRDVSAIAKSAPSGRSLSVPLYVLGSLTSHGVASSDALARVAQRIATGATDADLESLPSQPVTGDGNSSAAPGQVKHDGGNENGNAGGNGVGNGPGGVGNGAGGVGNGPGGVGNGPPAGVPGNGAGNGKGHDKPPGKPPKTPTPAHPGKP